MPARIITDVLLRRSERFDPCCHLTSELSPTGLAAVARHPTIADGVTYESGRPQCSVQARIMALVVASLCVHIASVAFQPVRAEPRHGIAMHGPPALPPDFKHFPYVNPDAPTGGELVLSHIGTYSSFNPYSLKGVPARGLKLVFQSLMARSRDEPFTLYGLIAERVETAPDRSWVEFTLNEKARFQDGRPITVDDVAFSHRILRDKGRPNHRTYYREVERVETPAPRRIRFVFKAGGNWELPLILGLMPVLPRHRYDAGRIEVADLTPPLGSGPYRVADFEGGRSVTFEKDPDYWGRDLPVHTGRYNFDRIRYDYYRDKTIALEAFKKGLIDVWFESNPADWHQSRTLPAVGDGRVKRLELPHGRVEGMYGFVFNTRRDLFADPAVRQALTLAFDFEWINRSFYFDGFVRASSFFSNSELAAAGPATAGERALLADFPGSVPPDIMESGYRPPVSDGSGRDRRNFQSAQRLLRQAGWRIENGRLVDGETGAPFTFEILVQRQESQRIGLAYQKWLKRLGIAASVRLVDSAQYRQRRETYDFDMIVNYWGMSLSPGNEQKFYWSTESADQPGTRNYPGIRSEAVDVLIDRIVAARTRPDLVDAVRALDRVLLAGNYVVPLFYRPFDAIAYWTGISPPAAPPLYGTEITDWWAAE